VASVYRLFGSKKAILSAVLQVAFVGDDEPAALHDRPEARAAAAQADPAALLAGYARVSRSVLARSGPLQQMLRVAAQADPEVHRLLTVERGLSADQYEDWLARALTAALL